MYLQNGANAVEFNKKTCEQKRLPLVDDYAAALQKRFSLSLKNKPEIKGLNPTVVQWLYEAMSDAAVVSAGGAVLRQHPAVHLHRSEARPHHQLALAGETHLTLTVTGATGSTSELQSNISERVCVCVFSGGVCASVDPHVLPVSGRPLLHHLVRALPPIHRHHRRAAPHPHYHGHQLDDHCCPTAHL